MKIENGNLRKYKLGEYIDSFGDGIHGTPNYDEKGEYYFINGNNLKDGQLNITEDTLKISSNEYSKIKRSLIPNNTILVSINGTLGNVALYKSENIALGKSACYLNLKDSSFRFFLRYLLETKEFKNYMNRVAGQSTIKNVSPTQISEYEFFAPPLESQQKIAAVLSALDDKIALNRRMNAKLELMAKRLYDHWFVQFDFPNADGKPYKSSGGKMVYSDVLKREIPAGWEAKKLGEIALIKRGTTITEKDTTKGNVKVVAGGLDFSYYHNQSNRKANCITVSGSGENAGFVNFWREPIFASDCSTVQCENDIDTMLCYFALKMQEKRFYRISHKSAQPHIYPKDVAEIPIVVPNEAVKSKISDFFLKSNGKIALIEKETQKLTSLRDRLLPLLMNGQVEVR